MSPHQRIVKLNSSSRRYRLFPGDCAAVTARIMVDAEDWRYLITIYKSARRNGCGPVHARLLITNTLRAIGLFR